MDVDPTEPNPPLPFHTSPNKESTDLSHFPPSNDLQIPSSFASHGVQDHETVHRSSMADQEAIH
jgi:hypothetical protein